ncbi:MAG: cytochrome b/b6 domain-containing protein [Coriobacteriia bacterium]|nr:cytochrome b/b6 domain-containing protein [Coriobacteriia bacterium]
MTRYIQRHSLLKRVIHGVHTVACLALIASGTILFVPALGRAVGSDVVQSVRMLHRVFAVVFISAPLLGMIVAPKGFVHIMKNFFAPWDADDKKFMMLFPKYLFSPKKTHMPKQHEVKSGQRLADGMLIAASVLIAITGVILWAGRFVSPEVFRTALMLHDVAFVLVTFIMCAHIYLGAGVFQPYRGSVRLMFGDGRVSEADALYHWGHWADEELASGENVVEA